MIAFLAGASYNPRFTFMKIQLCINHSENNRIKKQITTGETLSGNLRNESNIVNPVILVSTSNPAGYNYAYIPEWKRYYYIKDITSVRTGIWKLQLQSDPLMSFSSQILVCSGILEETTNTGKSNYLRGRNWVALEKSKTDIVTFPAGLNDNGEFILITAGG